MEKPLHIFCCYARTDQPLLVELKKRLIPLQHDGLISIHTDIDINPGEEWEQEIHKYLNTADIILLLISPDFLASEYCYSTEMTRALERYHKGNAHVIPIILRPVNLGDTPFGKIQSLPTNGKPVTTWRNQDEAFLDVANSIKKVIKPPDTPPPERSWEESQPNAPSRPKISPPRIVFVCLLVFVLLGATSIAAFYVVNKQKMDTATTQVARGNISATQTAATVVDVRANGVYAQGIPLVYDRLNANSQSKWSENRDPDGNWGCQFQGGAYHVNQKLQDSVVTCVAEGTDLPDYTYQVTMSLLKGDSGGLLFRVNSPKGMYLYYYFLIIPNGGKYQFGLFNGKFQPLQSDFSPAIITGLQQHNVLAVHVNKDAITLYANYQKIYSVKDTSYSHGAVGVFVYTHSSSTQAVFTDARIWTP